MRFKLIAIAIISMFLSREGIAQECAEVRDEHTAVQFLVDNKADSTAAYRYCVDNAFLTLTLATQFKNKNYIPFLVKMLDFERFVTEIEHADNTVPTYPAIESLVSLSRIRNVVPPLIRAIKQSDSELLRRNAAETLAYIGHCEALKELARAVERPEIPYEQRERLEAAEKQISDQYPNDLIWSCAATSQ